MNEGFPKKWCELVNPTKILEKCFLQKKIQEFTPFEIPIDHNIRLVPR